MPIISGGMELLFGKKKSHQIHLPFLTLTIGNLLFWMKDNILTDRLELFMQENTV